jgi:hypothetical protein
MDHVRMEIIGALYNKGGYVIHDGDTDALDEATIMVVPSIFSVPWCQLL